jgi:nucleoid-associated protein YgaU
MTIASNSRYAQSVVVPIVFNGKSRQTIVSSEQIPFVIQYTFHQVTSNERIDNIAFQFYGDATRWWVIADANPEILDWSTITEGTLIRVPVNG